MRAAGLADRRLACRKSVRPVVRRGSAGLLRQSGLDAGGGPPVHHVALDGFIQLGTGLAQERGRGLGIRILTQAFDGGPEGGPDRGVAPLAHAFLAQSLFG